MTLEQHDHQQIYPGSIVWPYRDATEAVRRPVDVHSVQ